MHIILTLVITNHNDNNWHKYININILIIFEFCLLNNCILTLSYPLGRLDVYILYLNLAELPKAQKEGGKCPNAPLTEPLFISIIQYRAGARFGGPWGKIFSKLQHLNKIVANLIKMQIKGNYKARMRQCLNSWIFQAFLLAKSLKTSPKSREM